MNLRFDYHYDVGRVRDRLHDIGYNISLITISDECLSYAGVDLITSIITSKKLTSLTIEGLDVSKWARQFTVRPVGAHADLAEPCQIASSPFSSLSGGLSPTRRTH